MIVTGRASGGNKIRLMASKTGRLGETRGALIFGNAECGKERAVPSFIGGEAAQRLLRQGTEYTAALDRQNPTIRIDHAPKPLQRVLARLGVEGKLRFCGILSLGSAIVPPLFLLWWLGAAPERIEKAALIEQICWTLVAQGFGLLVTGFISRRILRRMSRSLEKLGGVIAAITAGENDGHTGAAECSDEIGALAEALQTMITVGKADRQTLVDNNVALVLANESLAEANMELEAANKRVREFAEQAGSANAAKRTFLAVMSHEIRTPVNGIIGMTELAMKTRLDPAQRDYLETVNNTAQSLLDLLNEVLDFSKIEAGKLELEVTDFSLRSVVGDAVSGFAARHHSKDLALVLDIAPEVPDALIGDPFRLRQILVNLMSNAHRFTERGEVAVSVQVDEPGEVETRLRFSVTDTGCGIPREQQQAVFDLFTQGDSSTTRRFGGSGLGLTISSQLVQLMDGDIRVISEVGSGSRFDFTAVLGVGVPVPAAAPMPLAGRRALLIESNPRSAEVTARMLESWGMAVRTARCAAAGIPMIGEAAEAPFDFIIADTFHAGSGGLAFADFASRHDMHGARIVLLTSANRTDLSTLALPSSASLISKPVRESKLLETLRRALEPGGADATERTHPDAVTIPHGRILNVLIVEDNATNRRIIRTYLEAWGHRVVAAHDGADAVRYFAAEKFDLVLMDLQMPRMDGIAATASIRQNETSGSRVPIVALTANVLKGVREECHAAGMDGYLAKPIREHELLAAVEAVVPGLCAVSKVGGPTIFAIPTAFAQTAQPFHEAALVGSVNGSRQTLAGLLEDCRDGDFPELFAQLSTAVEARDPRGAQRAAHAIKGVISVFHAPAAFAAAKQLEEIARSGQTANLETHTAELRRTVSELLSSLERFVAASPLLSRAA